MPPRRGVPAPLAVSAGTVPTTSWPCPCPCAVESCHQCACRRSTGLQPSALPTPPQLPCSWEEAPPGPGVAGPGEQSLRAEGRKRGVWGPEGSLLGSGGLKMDAAPGSAPVYAKGFSTVSTYWLQGKRKEKKNHQPKVGSAGVVKEGEHEHGAVHNWSQVWGQQGQTAPHWCYACAQHSAEQSRRAQQSTEKHDTGRCRRRHSLCAGVVGVGRGGRRGGRESRAFHPENAKGVGGRSTPSGRPAARSR